MSEHMVQYLERLQAQSEAQSARPFELSRRGFLVGTGAAAIAVVFGTTASSVLAQIPSDSAQITNFVGIGADGKITILYYKAEMGQGVLTSLPVVIAEYMDADWDDVVIERALGVGGPIAAGTQNTVGSTSVSGQWNALRTAGLQVRAVLLENAARQLGVPVEELTTEPSVVVHAGSSRRLSYGEIVAAGIVMPESLPSFGSGQALGPNLDAAKDPATFRLIGSDLPRSDVKAKSDGTAVFGIDVDLPDMLYGAMLRPPVQGESPETIDDTAARAIGGVVEVVGTPDGVGVVAETLHAARQAVAALNVTWTNTAPARQFSSEQALADGRVQLAERELPEAFGNVARVVSLDFCTNFVAHACMEPMNATVLAHENDTFEVWASTQTPGNSQNAVRQAIGNNNAEVTVHVTLLGGGFGRRIENEFVRDATHLAVAVRGRPVKLVWSREDDLRFDPFRPLTVQRVDAGLDADNNIVAWRNAITSQAYGAGNPTSTVINFDAAPNSDFIVANGAGSPYSIPSQGAQYVFMPSGIKVGAWRAIGAAYQKWPTESMLDYVAGIRGQDPIEYRLSLLDRQNATAAAAARIIEIARDMSGWNDYQATSGRALGFAYSNAVNAHAATVVEASVDAQTGNITVHKVWLALDCGIAIQPRTIEAQMVSNIIFGLSPTLFEYVPVVNGEPQVTNLNAYRVMRQNDTPEIEVRVAPRGGAGVGPGGVGEAGLPPVLPAVANAVRSALGGVHVNYVPMLPEKVREAIAAHGSSAATTA